MKTQIQYDQKFLRECIYKANFSHDPRTQVGVLLIDFSKHFHHPVVICSGYNRFPRGITATEERKSNQMLKLSLIIHGEMEALLTAARTGPAVKNATMYVACKNKQGDIWGGVPCVRCTTALIEAGIKEVVSWPRKAKSKWHADMDLALPLLEEAGVNFREVPFP